MFRNYIDKIFLLMVVALPSILSSAQTRNDSSIIGTWKGESICQIKNSPCNNEIAVYHVLKTKESNTFHFVMNKLINGKEEEMGTLEYTYDAVAQTLTSIDEKRKTVWKFQIKNTAMNGTLLYKGELYRVIHLKKQQ